MVLLAVTRALGRAMVCGCMGTLPFPRLRLSPPARVRLLPWPWSLAPQDFGGFSLAVLPRFLVLASRADVWDLRVALKRESKPS